MINILNNITFYEVALRDFSMALCPDCWLAGTIPTKPPHQEDSRESGHMAIKKALGANAKSGPTGLFYGLVARFSRALLVGSIPANRATRP
jgi:hypothetical protein